MQRRWGVFVFCTRVHILCQCVICVCVYECVYVCWCVCVYPCVCVRMLCLPGRLYVARLLSLFPVPAVQQLMLQSLWLEQELGQVSASQGCVADSPMLSRPGLGEGGEEADI